MLCVEMCVCGGLTCKGESCRTCVAKGGIFVPICEHSCGILSHSNSNENKSLQAHAHVHLHVNLFSRVLASEFLASIASCDDDDCPFLGALSSKHHDPHDLDQYCNEWFSFRWMGMQEVVGGCEISVLCMNF